MNNLAGVPSIVFGLFGLGFFINFIGQNMDAILHPDNPAPVWGKPAIIWASLTLAVMTLPVVIIATEESLKAIPQGLREASLALGRDQTGNHFSDRFAAGVARHHDRRHSGGEPRGGRSRADTFYRRRVLHGAICPRRCTDQFMDLGYHVFILSTQSPNMDKTKPILYATVLVLLLLTFALNIVAILIRARMRKKLRLLA